MEHLGTDEQNPLEIQVAHHALAELTTALLLLLLSGTIIYYFLQEISQYVEMKFLDAITILMALKTY